MRTPSIILIKSDANFHYMSTMRNGFSKDNPKIRARPAWHISPRGFNLGNASESVRIPTPVRALSGAM